jgi:PhnB protein
MKVKPIPDGYHTITPYLAVHGVPKLIEFLENAFGAEVDHRHTLPDGQIMNATLKIGTSMVMTGELAPDRKPWNAMLYLYVEDADAVYRKAIDAGGKSIMEPADQFYGDRSGAIEDPSGNQWWIATHQEAVSDEELLRRARQQRG